MADFDKNLDKEVMHPDNCCTSFTLLGLHMLMTAKHQSGFTLMPRFVSINPRNFYTWTLKEHFFGLNFN